MSENVKKSGGIPNIFRGASASTVTIFIIFVLLCTILSIAQPAFLEPNNLLSTARAFSAYAIAGLVSDEELNPDYVLPAAFDPRVGKAVAKAVAKAAKDTGVSRI